MYVVSPMSIYLLGLVDILLPMLLLGAICLLGAAFFFAMETDSSYSEEKISKYKTLSKKYLVSSIIMVVLWAFIPSKETIVKMIIAKNVTVGRVQVASKIVEKIYNDIVNVLNK